MRRLALAAGLLIAGGAAVALAQGAPASQEQSFRAAAMAFMAMPGYLPRGMVPDSLLLNPPPPAEGSAALARDVEGAKAAVALRGSPRWDQATRDADLFHPESIGNVFSCAAGVGIGPTTTPALDHLLRRASRDLATSTNPTKDKYQRPRPFMVNGQPICTPEAEASLRANGSYPSGHSAIGYGWGLILAELVPGRSAEIVARGRAFGDSRRICNVHWLSDTEEGRVVATAVVARLHASAEFRADLDAARAELAQGKAPAPDAAACARETAALAAR